MNTTTKKVEALLMFDFLNRSIKSKSYRATDHDLWLADIATRLRSGCGEAYVEAHQALNMVIPSQATEGFSSVEGVETRNLSPNNNDSQECPASLRDEDIVPASEETRSLEVNSLGLVH